MTREEISSKLKYCGLKAYFKDNLFIRLINPFSALLETRFMGIALYKKRYYNVPIFRNKMEMIAAIGKLVTTSIGTFLWIGISYFIYGLMAKMTAAAALTATLHILSLPVGTVALGALGATPIGLLILGGLLIIGLGTAIAIGLYQKHYFNNMMKEYPATSSNAAVVQEPESPVPQPRNNLENHDQPGLYIPTPVDPKWRTSRNYREFSSVESANLPYVVRNGEYTTRMSASETRHQTHRNEKFLRHRP